LQFDLVMGSDVLYERRSEDALARGVARLCAPGGTIVLADPGRDHLQPAATMLRQAGYREHMEIVNEMFVLEFSTNRSAGRMRGSASG
jgi:predicted nicotinamide N-methyase